jgi:outer membrane protein assembly factor BamB
MLTSTKRTARFIVLDQITRKQFFNRTLAGLLAAVGSIKTPTMSAGGPAPGCTDAAGAEAWSRFRGPNGTGVVLNGKYPTRLTNVLWQRPVVNGKSSPVLADSKIFLTGARSGELQVICLDSRTGKMEWSKSITPRHQEERHTLNHAASPTPVTDGHNVYAFFPDFGVVSFDRMGKKRWQVPLGPFTTGWGVASSPVLVDGLLILQVDGYQGSFIASFDTTSGRERWRADRDRLSQNYSTPVLRKNSTGGCELLALGPRQVVSYDPLTGEKRWSAEAPGGSIVASLAMSENTLFTTSFAHESSPTWDWALQQFDKNGDRVLTKDEFPSLGRGTDDPNLNRAMVFLADYIGDRSGVLTADKWSVGWGELEGQSTVAAIRLDSMGDGHLKARTLWKHPRNVPHVPSPLFYDEVLYLLANGGILTTLQPETARVGKLGRLEGALGNYFASPVAADGKVFCLSEAGVLSVVKAHSDWELLSTYNLNEECYATPALSDGKLFVRTGDSLVCFGQD